MFHMFDTEVATRYGMNAAVIFQNIAFWCEHNRTNGTNYHEGHYWTYNSVRAFQEQFPYLGKNQISGALQKLVNEGLIIKGNYNNTCNRTTWYAVTELGETMFTKRENQFTQNGEMDLPKIRNRNIKNQKSIPDTHTDTENTYISHDGFDDFYSVYPKKVSKSLARKAWGKLKPDEELQKTILDDINRRMSGEWKGKELQYIPNPATYLNQRRWEDESSSTDKTDDDYYPNYQVYHVGDEFIEPVPRGG